MKRESLVERAVPLILQGMTNAQVCDQIGISRDYIGTIRATLKSQGAFDAPVYKPCTKCAKTIPSDSRFCPYCGSRILTREQELAERLEKCLNSASLLPSSAKDSFVKTVNEALAYFRERGKENAK